MLTPAGTGTSGTVAESSRLAENVENSDNICGGENVSCRVQNDVSTGDTYTAADSRSQHTITSSDGAGGHSSVSNNDAVPQEEDKDYVSVASIKVINHSQQTTCSISDDNMISSASVRVGIGSDSCPCGNYEVDEVVFGQTSNDGNGQLYCNTIDGYATNDGVKPSVGAGRSREQ